MLAKKNPKSVAEAIALYKRSELGRAMVAAGPIPGDVAIVCDMSGSMNQTVERTVLRGSRTRVEFLREALTEVMGLAPGATLIKFNNYTASVVKSPDLLGHPSGSTPVEAGLDLARQNGARHVVLISDGLPTDENAAMEAARAFAGNVVIDCVFVGPETDTYAMDFMRRLAAANGGQFVVRHLGEVGQPTLGQTIKRFLLPG